MNILNSQAPVGEIVSGEAPGGKELMMDATRKRLQEKIAKEVVIALNKLDELLDSPDKWLRNRWAQNSSGHCVSSTDKSAVRWCLSGAIRKCTVECTSHGITHWVLEDARYYLLQSFYDIFGRTYVNHCGLTECNDYFANFKTIKKAIKLAIQKAS